MSLQKEAILHIPHSNYSYPINKDTMHIYLRVKKDNIKEAFLCYYDPASWDKKLENFKIAKEKMHIRYTDSLFSYYFLSIKLYKKRMRYYFKIIDHNESIYYYNSKGLKGKSVKNNIRENGFSFNYPYIMQEDLPKVPAWSKNTIWYQIYPDRFFNDEKELENVISNDLFAGGNLKGIIKKVPYLKDLGIDGIYLTPIFKADTSHRYDTTDYEEIDQKLGSWDDFKNLVNTLHKNDMKIMIDGVFNHTSNKHKAFQDAYSKGKISKYFSSYFINGKNYETFANVERMPKVNHNNSLLENHFLKVVETLFKNYKIDALRLDVANELSLTFISKIKSIVKKYNGYLIGEIWDSYSYFMGKNLLDGVMNYELSKIIWEFLDEKITPNEFISYYQNYLFRYQDNYLFNYNQLGSHDTVRVFSRFKNDIKKFYFAYVLLFISMGSPSIYYGDEINMEGLEDPDCRRIMKFSNNKENSTFKFFKKLIKLRKKYEIFNVKDILFKLDGDILILQKNLNEEKLLLLVNIGKSLKKIDLKKYQINPKKVKELFDKSFSEKLSSYEYFLLKE